MARPETTVGSHARLRHTGQMGMGGWTMAEHSVQPWTRSRPSAPEVQNHAVAGVSSGSGLTVTRPEGWR